MGWVGRAAHNCCKCLGGLASEASGAQQTPPSPFTHLGVHLPQAQVEGLTCSQCRPHHFHLSASNPQGCLPCFCMGVTQQCASSSYSRHQVRASLPLMVGSTVFAGCQPPWRMPPSLGLRYCSSITEPSDLTPVPRPPGPLLLLISALSIPFI